MKHMLPGQELLSVMLYSGPAHVLNLKETNQPNKKNFNVKECVPKRLLPFFEAPTLLS